MWVWPYGGEAASSKRGTMALSDAAEPPGLSSVKHSALGHPQLAPRAHPSLHCLIRTLCAIPYQPAPLCHMGLY